MGRILPRKMRNASERYEMNCQFEMQTINALIEILNKHYPHVQASVSTNFLQPIRPDCCSHRHSRCSPPNSCCRLIMRRSRNRRLLTRVPHGFSPNAGCRTHSWVPTSRRGWDQAVMVRFGKLPPPAGCIRPSNSFMGSSRLPSRSRNQSTQSNQGSSPPFSSHARTGRSHRLPTRRRDGACR